MAKLQELASKYWWIVLLVFAGWAWLNQHDAAVTFRAQNEEQVKMLRRLSDTLASKDVQIVRKDSVLARLHQEISVKNRLLDRQAKEDSVAVVAATTTLRESLDSAQKVQLDAITSGFNSVIAAKNTQIANLSQLLAQDSTQLLEKSAQVERYMQLNRQLTVQLEKMLNADRPTVGKTMGRILPWAVAAAALIAR